MKTLLNLFLVFTICFTLHGQDYLSLESPKMNERYNDETFFPKVLGQLLNYSPEKHADLIIKYVIATPNDQVTKVADVGSDGSYKLVLESGLPYQQIWLSIGDYYYGQLLANEKLVVSADLDQLSKQDVRFHGDGIAFLGRDGALNDFANKFITYKRDERLKLKKRKQILMMNRNLSGIEKKKRFDQIYEELFRIERAFLEENPSPYSWLLENERMGDYYADAFLSHWGQEMTDSLYKEALSHQPLLMSNASYGYYSYLTTFLRIENPSDRLVNIENTLPKLITSERERAQYPQFITEYKKKLQKVEYDTLSVKDGSKAFLIGYKRELNDARLRSQISKLTLLPEYKFYMTALVGQPEDLELREKYLTEVLPNMKENWAKKLMLVNLAQDRKEITEISQKLNEGTMLDIETELGEAIIALPSGANLYEAKHESVDDLFASILSKYKNEAIILDIWATWCAPCIKDMKASKEIKQELKQLPVKVLYLCVEDNSSREKWKKKVAELDVEGDHIFLNSALSAELMSKFKLGGFPSYLFVNRKREIDKYYIQGISNIDIDDLKKKL